MPNYCKIIEDHHTEGYYVLECVKPPMRPIKVKVCVSNENEALRQANSEIDILSSAPPNNYIEFNCQD